MKSKVTCLDLTPGWCVPPRAKASHLLPTTNCATPILVLQDESSQCFVPSVCSQGLGYCTGHVLSTVVACEMKGQLHSASQQLCKFPSQVTSQVCQNFYKQQTAEICFTWYPQVLQSLTKYYARCFFIVIVFSRKPNKLTESLSLGTQKAMALD